MGEPHIRWAGLFVLILLIAATPTPGPAAASEEASPRPTSDVSPVVPTSPPPFFPNIRITDGSSPWLWHVEPTMVVNRSGTIFVGWKETDGPRAAGRRVGFSSSADGGFTWTGNILMDQLHASGWSNSDPWLALAPDDRVYYAYLEYGPDSGIDVRSTFDGETWGPIRHHPGLGGLSDKESIAVAPSGRLFLAWDEVGSPGTPDNKLQVTWSDDGGATWVPSVDPDDRPGNVLGVIVAAAPNGDVYLVWWDFLTNNILFDYSSDGGQTWHADRRVNDVAGTALSSGTWQLPLPAMVVDPASGAIYVAWTDLRDGTHDICVAASTDGGQTWSPSVRVNSVTTDIQYMVDLAVDRFGAVHAAWEDRRSGNWDIYYANSTDGGATWGPNVRASKESTPGTYDRPGDYFAIEVGPDDATYIVWTDGRGADFDIYFARNPTVEFVTVTVDTNPAGRRVIVDGTSVTVPAQYVWETGSVHTLEAPSPQPISDGVRYSWVSWSDGGAVSHAVTAAANVTITAAFVRQVRADLATVPAGLHLRIDNVLGTAPVVAWWDDGSTHTVEAPSPQDVDAATRYAWVSWNDGGARSRTVLASRPFAATASFQEEDALVLDTEPSGLRVLLAGIPHDAPATLWFPRGSSLTVDVETLQSGPPGVRHRFLSWSDGGQPVHVLVFNGPVTLVARFQTEYFLTVRSSGAPATGEGWYVAGSRVTASVPLAQLSVNTGERLAFTGWSGDAAGTGLTSDPIVMDGPKVAVAAWETQYFVRIVSSVSAVEGEGWYAAGSQAVLRAQPRAVEGEREYTFAGWTGDVVSSEPSVTVVVDGPLEVRAAWRPVLSSIVVVAATSAGVLIVAAILTALLLWRRRRRQGA